MNVDRAHPSIAHSSQKLESKIRKQKAKRASAKSLKDTKEMVDRRHAELDSIDSIIYLQVAFLLFKKRG